MKKLFFVLTSIVTLGVSISSCTYVDVLTHKIKRIDFSDSKSAYVVGDYYLEKSNLFIQAEYFDGNKVELTKNDVVFTLKKNGITYDISKPLSSAGDYSLSVSKDKVYSSEITISVFSSEQYVNNIQVNSTSSSVVQGRFIDLSLVVNPTKFTVDIEYAIDDESLISVTKNNSISYRVKGLKDGDTKLTFKAKNSLETYLTAVFDVSVIKSAKTEIKQTLNDYSGRNAYGTSYCPSVGNPKLLVIPVWFTDSSTFGITKKDNIREDINTVFFGTASQVGWHSVSSYYEAESFNKLHLTGTVSEWYNSSISAATYSDYNTTKQDSFVKSAVNWYFNNHADDRTNYDSNKDGYLDGVMFVYAAPDCQLYQNFSDNMWAFCSWVSNPSKNVDNPGINDFFWASYDFIYGSNAVNRTGASYANGDTSHCNLDTHTYIHEMGHILGLEDYYDYSEHYKPAGSFSMQDYNVGGHDPFSTMTLGWADPFIPHGSQEIEIYDFQSSHDFILLTPSWNSFDSSFDEYLLLELYTPTVLNKHDCDYRYHGRYPKGPSDIGIRLWHVDSRLYIGGSRNFTVNALSRGYALAFNNTFKNKTELPDKGRDSYSYFYSRNITNQRLDLLHLIRKDNCSYEVFSELGSSSLFYQGDSFRMNTYKSQFYKNDGKLNSGETLGWSFVVKSIVDNGDGTYKSKIQVVKE